MNTHTIHIFCMQWCVFHILVMNILAQEGMRRTLKLLGRKSIQNGENWCMMYYFKKINTSGNKTIIFPVLYESIDAWLSILKLENKQWFYKVNLLHSRLTMESFGSNKSSTFIQSLNSLAFLSDTTIILASASPRRKEILDSLVRPKYLVIIH